MVEIKAERYATSLRKCHFCTLGRVNGELQLWEPVFRADLSEPGRLPTFENLGSVRQGRAVVCDNQDGGQYVTDLASGWVMGPLSRSQELII